MIRPVGTEFDVTVADTLGMSVYSGTVIVETGDGETRVSAGQRLIVDQAAKSVVNPVQRDDPRWWTAAVPVRWTDVVNRD